MLDLNYVRDNFDAVRGALGTRGFPTDLLDRFAEIDKERRRVIGEADSINQQRNASSKEIGALMQAGKRDEADAKKADVAGLKEKQSELEAARDDAESAMREILVNLPNIPADDVPVGADESANKEIRRWGEPREFDFEPKDHVAVTGRPLGLAVARHPGYRASDKDRGFAIRDPEWCRRQAGAGLSQLYARYPHDRAWICRNFAAVHGQSEVSFWNRPAS